MKKITLLFAAIALAFAAQAQEPKTYKVLKVYIGDSVAYELPISKIDSLAFENRIDPFNGHEYVDLGLPSGTLWATCNVGATNPEDYGDYFAWGETIPRQANADGDTIYNWITYKYCNGSSSTLTKYCNDANYGNEGYTDDLVTIEAADDAATANWGGDWRIPTKTEQDELRTECQWDWTDNYNNTGIAGYIVSSKKDTMKSIFLPAAGYRSGTSLNYAGSYGYYWSSSLYESYPNGAYYLYFYSGGYDWSGRSRYYGHSVRPVCSLQH